MRKKKESWPKKDGMGCTNYQLNSFHSNEIHIALSIFFADEYVNRYAVKNDSFEFLIYSLKIKYFVDKVFLNKIRQNTYVK